MRVPELHLDRFLQVPFPVATVRELRRKKKIQVEAMDRHFLLLWNNGTPRAFQAHCPHLGLPMIQGRLQGDAIRCRFHDWSFSTDTGEVQEQPTLPHPQRCKMKRFGCMIYGDLVLAWLGDPDAIDEARAWLPEREPRGISIMRVPMGCPFYLALFNSVDYAHFPMHRLYRPFYAVYGRFFPNGHRPGSPFAPQVVEETDHMVRLRIEEANREIRMYATCSEMWDSQVNCFQAWVTPISASRSLYWECYTPTSRNPVVKLAARTAFHLITRRLLWDEDKVWADSSAPFWNRGENLNLTINDRALGAHLRKFVQPRAG